MTVAVEVTVGVRVTNSVGVISLAAGGGVCVRVSVGVAVWAPV